ncbi:uncharacterized protein LOC105701235 isoform X2 [Orussus abietinus]|uniref:uncharacterized protein LOC105701235 isoform X2 n=1 Tax=Orussus abietinus TaxID=222816 RepID=UPI0006262B72|nr:uncharacterized protein LOC105701235 isoform X2 [Orussus abietinus]
MIYMIMCFVILCGVPTYLSLSSDRCCQISQQESPRYKLLKTGIRSTQTVLSRKQVPDLADCIKFAVSKKALAFNFSNNISSHGNSSQHHKREGLDNENCILFECPELNNFTTITNDTRFKYYSMYRGDLMISIGQVQCIPKVGIFLLSMNKKNYTKARESCQKLNGSLAHVVSEERTEGLAKLISESLTFFVGLSNRDKERIWTNEFNEPLDCFNYRAWGPREPTHSRGCVGLVQPEDLSMVYWKVLPCDLSTSYICEIFPMQQRRSKVSS